MLSSLRLRNFRCIESLDCALGDEVTIFMGDNAQGKTSILESICFLLRLQSPRTSLATEAIKVGQGIFGIAGQFKDRAFQFTFDGKRRRLKIDGEVLNRGDYLDSSGLVVWIGNDDLQLIRGSSEQRRRYLDFAATQLHHSYRPALNAYEKAVRTRNFLLKRDATPNWAQIDAYTKVLLQHGQIITTIRADLVEALQPWSEDAQRSISGRGEVLGIEYHNASTDDFAAALEASRSEELRKRQTLVGPHRDDLKLTISGMPAAQFASEGQQRTIAISMKLAQAKLLEQLRRQAPVLLVDDVFGELDGARRNALLAYLPKDSQKLITTTNLDWADVEMRDAARIYVVEAGTLT
jgi:DNA replication and repair protein RecF